MTDQTDLAKLIFGRLTWDAIPLHEPILIATFAMVALGNALHHLASGATCGANGSPASTTRRSGSCT